MKIKKLFSLDWLRSLGKPNTNQSAENEPKDFFVNPDGLTKGQVKTLKLFAEQELPPDIFAKSVDNENWGAFEEINGGLTAIANDLNNAKQGNARRCLKDIAAAAKTFANAINDQEIGSERVEAISKTLIDVCIQLERATRFLADENHITDSLRATTGERYKFLQAMEKSRLRLVEKAVKDYVMTLPDASMDLLVAEIKKCDPRTVPFLQEIFEIKELYEIKPAEWSWGPGRNARPSDEIQMGVRQIQKSLLRQTGQKSIALKLALEKVELALLVDQNDSLTN